MGILLRVMREANRNQLPCSTWMRPFSTSAPVFTHKAPAASGSSLRPAKDCGQH